MEKALDIFYVFIPGLLYLLVWMIIYLDKIKEFLIGKEVFIEKMSQMDFLMGIFIILFSLSIGFLLHGLLQILKKNDDGCLKGFRCLKYKKLFYSANRWLWTQDKRDLPEFHSNRSALFGNLFIGGILTILLILIHKPSQIIATVNELLLFLLLIVLICIFFYLWKDYSNKHVDTVIRLFDESGIPKNEEIQSELKRYKQDPQNNE